MILDEKANQVARRILDDKYETMVRLFFEEAQHYIQDIEKAIERRSAAEAILPAHTLKSSCATLGAYDLSEAARRMELALKDCAEGKSAFDTGIFGYLLEKMHESMRATLPFFPEIDLEPALPAQKESGHPDGRFLTLFRKG